MFRATGPDTYKGIQMLVTAEAFDSRVEDSEYEYSWRIDGMTWSAFQPQSTFLITHPILLLQGHHELEVRARRVDDYHIDPTPAIHEFSIDTQPPMLTTRSDGRVRQVLICVTRGTRVEYQVHERIVGIDGDEFPFDPQASVIAQHQAGLHPR